MTMDDPLLSTDEVAALLGDGANRTYVYMLKNQGFLIPEEEETPLGKKRLFFRRSHVLAFKKQRAEERFHRERIKDLRKRQRYSSSSHSEDDSEGSRVIA